MKREQMGVIGNHEHAIAEHRHTAIDPAGCVTGQALAARPAIMPDLAAAARVEAGEGHSVVIMDVGDQGDRDPVADQLDGLVQSVEDDAEAFKNMNAFAKLRQLVFEPLAHRLQTEI